MAIGRRKIEHQDDCANFQSRESVSEDAYARGVEQGVTTARLDAHDAKFVVINGNIARFATESAGLAEAVRELSGDIKTSHETARVLREADKDRAAEIEQRRLALVASDDERAKKAARKFQPFARGMALLAGAEGLLLTWLTYHQATGKG